MGVGVIGDVVPFIHQTAGEMRSGVDLGTDKKKSGVQLAFGKFRQNTLGHARGGPVIKSEGQAVSKTGPAIDEVGVHLRLALEGGGIGLSPCRREQTGSRKGE